MSGGLVRRRRFIGLVGGAVVLPISWPLTVQAEQLAKPHRLGYLALLLGENATFAKPLLQRLQELGYREGQTMVWDYRSADGHPERLPQLAVELVRASPDVLITGFGTLAPKAAIAATQSILIVFTGVGDPVGAGLIKSLREPGGNATGMSGLATDVAAKRLQLLIDVVPEKKLVAVLGNPDTPYTALALAQVKMAAAIMGVPFKVFEAKKVDQVPTAISQAVEGGAASMLVLEDPVLLGAIQQTTDLVAKARLSTIFGQREYVHAGGLIAYGSDQSELSRKAADYVDKILKGASPSNLPVEQPTKFDLIINLRTAKALGLTIPPSVLSIADEVIE
jgi:putative tryptophan/tyrosine transport system substrate-binding protein